MKLNFSPPPKSLTAWGIDLGTTNSTLCRTTLAAGATVPAEPEVVELRQPTQAGTFIGTLVPSMVAVHQGQEFIGEGAKNLRALMADSARGVSRNVSLFHDCKNEIGTSRTYPNAPSGYRLESSSSRCSMRRRTAQRPTSIASSMLRFICTDWT